MIEWGYLVLLGTLVQAVLAGLLLIVLPLAGRGGGAVEGARVVVYFFALGLAFLFIEIAFIHRLALFLGHPILAAALALGGFLVFAGLGSGATAALAARLTPSRAIGLAVAAIVAIGLAYLAWLPALLAALAGLGLASKMAVAGALIAPLGFAMGMPFPLGLAWLARRAPGRIPWAWAINGCASVIGAVAATLVAIHDGFGTVIAVALALYVVAAVCLVAGDARRPPDGAAA